MYGLKRHRDTIDGNFSSMLGMVGSRISKLVTLPFGETQILTRAWNGALLPHCAGSCTIYGLCPGSTSRSCCPTIAVVLTTRPPSLGSCSSLTSKSTLRARLELDFESYGLQAYAALVSGAVSSPTARAPL